MSDNNQLKIKRKSYFVLEAIHEMEAWGTSKLSARTVARAAGFNPSSIYTYFESMDHLESLASISFTKPYLLNLSQGFQRCNSWLERYICMWELFLSDTFQNPMQFAKVFYPTSDEDWAQKLYAEYFEMFPEEFIFDDEDTSAFLMIGSAKRGYHRDEYLIKKSIEEGSILPDAWEYIVEINIAYTYYVIADILHSSPKQAEDAVYYKCMKYIILTVYPHAAEEQRPFLTTKLAEYAAGKCRPTPSSVKKRPKPH